MYSGDNEFYLHRAYDGSYLYAGSVFLDGSVQSGFFGNGEHSVRSPHEQRQYVCGCGEIHG